MPPPTINPPTTYAGPRKRIFKAQKPWPPDFSKLDPKYQFRLERRYKRRSQQAWARPKWNRGVKVVQWCTISGEFWLCPEREGRGRDGAVAANRALQELYEYYTTHHARHVEMWFRDVQAVDCVEKKALLLSHFDRSVQSDR
ncbi:hypothetical protein MMC25_005334 [Agyrium rufum]|nr:hypothetical protein [Agyrium rufum]